ncbi:MAG: FtsX-like permease family protein [Lachnoclostridium sp.]|nr:FtsX-like permease family protein [Lachnoclostridium sp.]
MVGKGRKNRLLTDALREVWNTRSRFFSILILSALAVAFLSGIKITAPDMQYTADKFYDMQNVMDGYVLSTLGLVEDDIEALKQVDGILDVEGGYTLDAKALDGVVIVRSIPERMNLLDVLDGRLPERTDECVTEENLLIQLGLQVGDRLPFVVSEDNEDSLETFEYTIVGTVKSPLYMGPDRGTSSLGTGSVDGFVYIPRESFTLDYYTVAFFTADDLIDLNTYSDEYDDRIDALVDSMETFADERAVLRKENLIADAQAEIDDAWAELNDVKADVEEELADAWQELQDGRQELDDGWVEYYDGIQELEDSVLEANQEIADAEVELADALVELNDAEQKLADGRKDLDDGWKDYEDGVAEYYDGYQEYLDGKSEYEDGLKEYQDGLKEIKKGKKELAAAKTTLNEKEAEFTQGKEQFDQVAGAIWMIASASNCGYQSPDDLIAGAVAGDPLAAMVIDQSLAYLPFIPMDSGMVVESYLGLQEGRKQLDQGWKEYHSGQEELEDGSDELASAKFQLEDAKEELADAEEELADGKEALDQALTTLLEAEEELKIGREDLDHGWKEYYDGLEELADARVTLKEEVEDAEKELADALVELNDGEKEYADGLEEYEDGKQEAAEEIADAEVKLADAQAELDDIDDCEWYVLSRKTNVGIASYGQDSQRISNLADVFPIIFFLVAALACLTTMTRMVEEQRTQIGSMKALGFSYLAISVKYIGYAFAASLIGGLLGLQAGKLIPLVIANAFNIMYVMPPVEFMFQPDVSITAVLAAVVCTTGAALWACGSTLAATPAALMRPKAPRAGKRVFLEHIGPLWRSLNFTWKVTMRNLLRYKRRFWMTVIGIGGCTALIVTGFGLHNSIFEILDKQFDEILLYDVSVGLEEEIDEDARLDIYQYLDEIPEIDRWLACHNEMVDSSGEAAVENGVNVFAVNHMEELEHFVDMRHRLSSEEVIFPEEGVVITEKLSELLDIQIGGMITLDGDRRVDVPVADIVENYTQHYVYMTKEYYEQVFQTEADDNVILFAYTDGSQETFSEDAVSQEISTTMMEMEGVATFSRVASLRETFTESMVSIDYAVVIVIVAAAVLAFVVLYNLTNINITERTRELATLKVLGFYDGETSAYVYRENIFLTIFGIMMGLVMGRFLHSWLILTVEVNQVMFGRTAPTYAYVYAAILTVLFSAIVNVAAHFKLKKVDMVESLKTVE